MGSAATIRAGVSRFRVTQCWLGRVGYRMHAGKGMPSWYGEALRCKIYKMSTVDGEEQVVDTCAVFEPHRLFHLTLLLLRPSSTIVGGSTVHARSGQHAEPIIMLTGHKIDNSWHLDSRRRMNDGIPTRASAQRRLSLQEVHRRMSCKVTVLSAVGIIVSRSRVAARVVFMMLNENEIAAGSA